MIGKMAEVSGEISILGRIVWKAVRGGGKSEEQSEPEGTIRDRLALLLGVQTAFGLFTVRSRLVES